VLNYQAGKNLALIIQKLQELSESQIMAVLSFIEFLKTNETLFRQEAQKGESSNERTYISAETVRGIFRNSPVSVDDFIREKHENNKRDEKRLERNFKTGDSSG